MRPHWRDDCFSIHCGPSWASPPLAAMAEVLPDVADMTPNLGYCRLRPLASVCHVNPWIHLFFGSKIKLQPDQIVFQHFDETLSVEPTGVERFLRLFFGR